MECKKRIVALFVMEIGMLFLTKEEECSTTPNRSHLSVTSFLLCRGRSSWPATLSVECVGQDCGSGSTGGSWFLRTDEQLIMVKSSKCPGSF